MNENGTSAFVLYILCLESMVSKNRQNIFLCLFKNLDYSYTQFTHYLIICSPHEHRDYVGPKADAQA
jgi:hypothetical protein